MLTFLNKDPGFHFRGTFLNFSPHLLNFFSSSFLLLRLIKKKQGKKSSNPLKISIKISPSPFYHFNLTPSVIPCLFVILDFSWNSSSLLGYLHIDNLIFSNLLLQIWNTRLQESYYPLYKAKWRNGRQLTCWRLKYMFLNGLDELEVLIAITLLVSIYHASTIRIRQRVISIGKTMI